LRHQVGSLIGRAWRTPLGRGPGDAEKQNGETEASPCSFVCRSNVCRSNVRRSNVLRIEVR